MKAMVKRAGAIALALVVVTAFPLAAWGNCADNITSGGEDAPLTGWLMGERSVSTTTSYSYKGSWTFMNFGGTFDGTRTVTETHWEGSYKMTDGSIRNIRCDTYQPV
jgi:hypothetical protein